MNYADKVTGFSVVGQFEIGFLSGPVLGYGSAWQKRPSEPKEKRDLILARSLTPSSSKLLKARPLSRKSLVADIPVEIVERGL